MRTLLSIVTVSASLASGCVPAHPPGPWVSAEPPEMTESAPSGPKVRSLSVRALVTGGDLTGASEALLDALREEVEAPTPPAFRLHLHDHGAVTLVSCHRGGDPAADGQSPRPCARLPADVTETPSEYLSETIDLEPGVSRRWVHPTHIELRLPDPAAPAVLLRMTVVPHLPTDAAQASVLRQVVASLPPRAAGVLSVLVLPQPVESAGPMGQGGRHASAVYHRLPAPLRGRIEGGYFDLVLASGDAGAQWSADISDAVARSSKVWIRRPLAQLVIDGMRQPALRRRGTPWTRGTSLRPDLFSQHLGFARVDFVGGVAMPTLVVRRGRRWLEATAAAPVGQSDSLPARRAVPSMAPCRDCDEASGLRPAP